MRGNGINLSIKPSSKLSQDQSHQIVNIGEYCYNPCDSVGLGYVSNVYLGKNTKTNEKVAVKVIDTTEKDKLVLQFLESEISMLEKIKNYGCEHLLRLEETFRVDNKVYIVTEFCEGKDLSKVLRQQKAFSDKDAQTIMKQVMKTYKELYDLGIVHRDLKLSNLLVKNGKIKLADFGFALSIINCIEEFPYNAGSPFFMSPEALRRNRFSFESDVWALGVMAFELVFGKLPFQQKVESVLYETIMKTNIEDKLQEIHLSEVYKKFISKCLEKDMRVRATPQEVINYEWPLAEAQLPHCFRLQSLQMTENPHLPQQFNSTRPNKSAQDEGTLKSSLSSSDVRGERIRIVEFRPRSDFFQGAVHQRRFPLTQPPSTSIPLAVRGPSRTFTQIPMQSPVVKKELSNKEILDGVFKTNQSIVGSIIEYCKFLFHLYQMLEEDNVLPEGYKLKAEISSKILYNYAEISSYLEGRENKFGLIGALGDFSRTQEYFTIRNNVEVNRNFFNEKFRLLERVDTHPFVLKNSIRFLKDKIPSKFVLTEELCHYLVLREAEDQGINYFVTHSKLFWLNSRPLSRKIMLSDCKKLQLWVNQLVH